jgi:hypothetical protein
MNLSPSLVKRLITCIALLGTSHIVCAQKFEVNAIHCSMNADDIAMMNKIGKFEGHFYNVIFNTGINDTVTVKINLYGRHGEYKKEQNNDIHTTFIDGFYSGDQNQIYLYKTDDYMNILLHESSHALLRHNLSPSPKWLNEGIATLFGRMVIDNKDQVFYVKQTHYIKGMKDIIATGSFNLTDFFHYRSSDWFDADKREALYTVSYCLVYFFVQTNIDDLQRFMLLLKQGNSTPSAINKMYGSMDKFQNQFLKFYSNESAYSVE